jgi:hypothetical protein
MIHTLLTDYIFKKAFPKNQAMQIFCYVADLHHYLKITDSGVATIEYKPGGPFNPQSFAEVAPVVNRDMGVVSLLFALRELKENENHVFSKSLTKALIDTDMEIGRKYLPDNYCGFFKMEGLVGYHNAPSVGVFVQIGDHENGKKFLAVVSIDKEQNGHYSTSYCKINLDKETLKECVFSVGKLKHDVLDEESLVIGKRIEEIKEVPDFFKAAINGLLFATYTETELELSKFEGNKNAQETQRKIYTNLPYKYHGRDFKLPGRETYVDATIVSGHFRWQPCGPERKSVKHIYIEPHVRRYEK